MAVAWAQGLSVRLFPLHFSLRCSVKPLILIAGRASSFPPSFRAVEMKGSAWESHV